jgi:hypothetical protein
MDRARRIPGLLFAALAICILPSAAHAAGDRALPRTQAGRHASWVVSDLDGDRQTDLATTGASRRDGREYVQEISLRFSAFAGDTVTVRTRLAAERLTARDLDGDSDRDLILEAFNREPVAVLLNDGDGHFHQADLAEFFFQLSHRSPRGFDSNDRESPEPESGECPNDEPVAVRCCTCGPALAGARLIVWLEFPRPVSCHAGVKSRGPPSLQLIPAHV